MFWKICVVLLLALVALFCVAGCKKAAEKQIETGTEVMQELMKGEAESMKNAATQAGTETYNEMKDATAGTAQDVKSTAETITEDAKTATKEAGEKAKEAFKDVKKLFGD